MHVCGNVCLCVSTLRVCVVYMMWCVCGVYVCAKRSCHLPIGTVCLPLTIPVSSQHSPLHNTSYSSLNVAVGKLHVCVCACVVVIGNSRNGETRPAQGELLEVLRCKHFRMVRISCDRSNQNLFKTCQTSQISWEEGRARIAN